MHTQNRRHRLFIALPLFALCIAWSVVGGIVESRQSPVASLQDLYIEATDVRVVAVQGGVIRLQPGAVLEHTEGAYRITAGQALVVADDWLTIQAGDALLSGWSGGWFVTVDADRVNLAALTTPVRVDRKGTTTIVPARMQSTSLSDNTLLALPAHFLREQLPFVFAHSVSSESKVRQLLSDDEDIVLLSLHPERRTVVWTLPLPEQTSVSERLLCVTLLPLSDRLPSALPTQIVDFWAEDIASLLLVDDASGSLLRTQLPILASHIATLSRDGYPDRARRYASHLLDILTNASFDSGPTMQMLKAVLASVPVPFQDSAPAPEVTIPIVQAAALDPEQLITAVTDALHTAGFMFTKQTVILSEGTVATVSDVVLGTLNGDQLLHFSYDPASDLVSHIEQDGQVLPFSLSLEKYVGWLRGGE